MDKFFGCFSLWKTKAFLNKIFLPSFSRFTSRKLRYAHFNHAYYYYYLDLFIKKN